MITCSTSMKAASSHPGSEGTSRVDARSVLVGAVTGLSTSWLALATTDLLYKLVAFRKLSDMSLDDVITTDPIISRYAGVLHAGESVG